MEDRVLNPQVRFPECIVLYVEDDDATAYLFQRALVQTGTRVHVFRVRDGEEGISFLFHEGLYHEAPIPDLVVLDIALPKMTGLDVLAAIRSKEHLKYVPVVVLTSSASPAERQRALDLGANEFYLKGPDWRDIIATGKSVCDIALRRASAKHRVVDLNARHVDYHLSVLGVRVSENVCRLIAKLGNEWQELGDPRRLPVTIPSTPSELVAVGEDLVALIAYQYEHEHPSTDLREMLKQGWRYP